MAGNATPKTTEDEILSNIAGATGDDLEDNLPNEEGDDGQSDDEADGQAAADDGDGNQAGDEGSDDEAGERTSKAQQAANGKGDEERKPTVKRDEKGNLVDKDGKIIAKAGPERRVYEELTRTRARLRHIDAENQKMARQLGEMNYLNGLPKKYGLSNDEVATFMNFMAVGKANPIEGVRLVIAEAVKQGITLQQILGEDGEGVRSIDTSAVQRMLDERLAPIQKREQEEQRARENEERALAEYNTFVQDYPDAELHADALAHLMGKVARPEDTRYQTAERAYLHLERFAVQHGLDFSQPLGPQIEAAQRRGASPQDQRRPKRPMPGRGSRADRATQEPVMANATDDWGTIISGVMAENGA